MISILLVAAFLISSCIWDTAGAAAALYSLMNQSVYSFKVFSYLPVPVARSWYRPMMHIFTPVMIGRAATGKATFSSATPAVKGMEKYSTAFKNLTRSGAMRPHSFYEAAGWLVPCHN